MTPTNIRLTKEEQRNLRKKAIEINKILVKEGLEPLKISELAHKLLGISIAYANVKSSGELYLKC